MENNLENSKETTKESTEQKTDTASLEARIKQLESENGKLKQSVTNASADASEWKKKYQGKLSEEEKKQQEQETAYAAMQEKVATLEARERIANFTAALGASDIGMDAETAKSVAEALHSGETDKVFDGIRKFISAHDKAMAEKAMMNNPTLPGGETVKIATKDEFLAMDVAGMTAFKREHPDLFTEYTK